MVKFGFPNKGIPRQIFLKNVFSKTVNSYFENVFSLEKMLPYYFMKTSENLFLRCIPANIYFVKVNNRNARNSRHSTLTLQAQERRQ